MAMSGLIKEIEPPSRIVSREIFDEDWTGGETVSTLLFEERDGRTHLTNTIVYASAEAREAALKTGMTEGMEMGFGNLDRLLAVTPR